MSSVVAGVLTWFSANIINYVSHATMDSLFDSLTLSLSMLTVNDGTKIC